MDIKQQMEEARRDVLEASGLERMDGSIGGLSSFNMEHGLLEAIVRGFRSGFMKANEYRQLSQCENLEDVKLALADTDYCQVLQNVNKLTPEIIYKKCEEKFIQEFTFIQSQAVGQLATFLDFITYEDLLTNISFIMTSLIRGADPETLLSKCLPLGRSPHLRSILTFDNSESSDALVELYRTVLVDTPVAGYFEQFFNSELRSEAPNREMQKVYSEVEIDIITNTLQKLWLEDFHSFCQSLGGDSSELMSELLSFEADRRAIAITVNSFGTALNDPSARDNERKNLYCSFGMLYPEATNFQFSKVGDINQLATVLEPYKIYSELWRQSADGSKSFTDLLYAHEVNLMLGAFDGQSQFAAFYGWVKLKKQELRNIKWILSCINLKRDQKDTNRWVKIM